MYIDSQLQFADSQALTGDEVSDNIIDLGLPRNIGVGEVLYVGVVVEAAITGTLQVNVETDDNEGFSSATVSADIGSFAASAAAGDSLYYKVSPDVMNERYVRLDFNGATGGTVSAFITHDIDAFTAYAKGYTIS
jgi:hypothetical protein